MKTRVLGGLLACACAVASSVTTAEATGATTSWSATVQFGSWPQDRAVDVAADGSGRVVVVGGAAKKTDGGVRTVWAMARFAADGSLDDSFDGDGKLLKVVPFHGGAEYVANRPGGGYYVAGEIKEQGSFGYAIAAVTDDGSLDTSWGDTGTVSWLGDHKRYLFGLSIADDDSLVLMTDGSDDASRPAVVTYAADGTFGSEVIGRNPSVSYPYGMLYLPDGSFLTDTYSVAGHNEQIAKFEADGSPAGGFGDDGTVTRGYGPGVSYPGVITSGGRGRLLVASAGGPLRDEQADWALMRLEPDGDLDPSFGDQGVVRVTGSKSVSSIRDIRVLPDGKILASGVWNHKVRVMEFNADGSATKSFRQMRYDHRSVGHAIDVDPGHVYSAGWRTRSTWDQPMLVVTGSR